MTSASLELDGLTRRFGEHLAVDRVSLSLNAGELLALVGASGSGKTTTLRMIAGYEVPDSGRVILNGRDITGLPPQARGFGMVFQHYALFPHMPVRDNVAFGLEARGIGTRERRERALAALETVGLAGAAERKVQSLSGGEQQRVALARAVVIEPRVLLLDEPLSNLDPTLRRTMRDELRSMLRKLNVTALLVTHDQEDAFAVADRVALLRGGRLLQVGRPEELYRTPASREVASFIGKASLLPARVMREEVSITIAGVTLTARLASQRADEHPGAGWLAVLRPEMLEVRRAGDGAARTGGNLGGGGVGGSAGGGWPGTVESSRFAGAAFVYHVRLADSRYVEAVSLAAVASEGDDVIVSLREGAVAVVPV